MYAIAYTCFYHIPFLGTYVNEYVYSVLWIYQVNEHTHFMLKLYNTVAINCVPSILNSFSYILSKENLIE